MKYRFLLLFFLIPVFLSCEDVVDVDLDEKDIGLISVEAYINTKATDNIFVKLEKSLPVSNPNRNPAIHHARVEISDDEPTPRTVLLVEEGASGVYKLPENMVYRGVPGRTYTLTITTPEGVTITGKEYLQKVEQLDTTKIHLSARGNFEFLAVFISSQETPGPGHYYKWDIFKNGQLLYKSFQMSFVSDEFVDGNYVSDFEIYTDFTPPNEPDDKEFRLGDSVYVEQNSISKSAYDFYFGMVNQAFAGAPFSVPPASLPTNLTSSDGKRVLGLFSARDVSVGNGIVIDSTNFTPLTPGNL